MPDETVRNFTQWRHLMIITMLVLEGDHETSCTAYATQAEAQAAAAAAIRDDWKYDADKPPETDDFNALYEWHEEHAYMGSLQLSLHEQDITDIVHTNAELNDKLSRIQADVDRVNQRLDEQVSKIQTEQSIK